MKYFEDIYGNYDTVSPISSPILQVKGVIWSSYTHHSKALVGALINKDTQKAAIELERLFQLNGYSCLKDIDGAYVMGMRILGTQYLYKSLLCKTSLYYRLANHKLVWSTNPLKLLDASKPILQQVDRDSVLLTCLGESVPPDKSHYKDIHRLPAGYLLSFKDGEINLIRIESLTVNNSFKKSTLADYADQTRQILQATLKKRIGSLDKNIGVILSGGIDSSAALYICQQAGLNVSAYHWSFPNIKSADESYYARLVTDHLNVPLQEIDATSLIKSGSYLKPAWEFQAPYNHSFYRLFEMTRDLCLSNNTHNLTSGYLGDNLFGRRTSEFEDISFRSLLKTLSIREALRYTREKMGTLYFGVKPRTVPNIYCRMSRYENYLTEAAKKSIRYYTSSVESPKDTAEFFYRCSDNETEAVLESHLFERKEMNMLYIFASREMMEFSLALPLCYRMTPAGSQWIDKPILRYAFIDLLPKEIISRNHRQLLDAMDEEYVIQNPKQIAYLLGDNSFLSAFEIIDGQKLSEVLTNKHLATRAASGLICCCMTELWLKSISKQFKLNSVNLETGGFRCLNYEKK